jgi:hypothetical protein
MSSFIRVMRWISTALVVISAIIVLLSRGRDLHLGRLVALVIVAAIVGAVIGTVIRFSVPLERRLRVMRGLNPRLARRFLPPENDGPSDEADGA